MRLSIFFETEVLLHHILVETAHYDGDECTRDELLEEVVVVAPEVREIEDLELRVRADGRGHFEKWHAEFVFDGKYSEYYGKDEEEGLDEVGPYDRFDATFDSISPDEKYRNNGIESKWETERVEYGDL